MSSAIRVCLLVDDYGVNFVLGEGFIFSARITVTSCERRVIQSEIFCNVESWIIRPGKYCLHVQCWILRLERAMFALFEFVRH